MYLVCGEALFDVFMEQQQLDSIQMNARVGGSPFNVAIGLARLGQASALLTGVSTDVLGNQLANMLQSESVSTDYLLRSGRRTTLSLINLKPDGQPEYVFYGLGSADCSITEADLPQIGPEVRGIHFGSYSLVVKPVADAFASMLEKYTDRFISVDPNVRPTIEPDMQVWRERVAQYAKYANLLKISAEDVEYLYPQSTPEQMAREWLQAGVQLVIVTDGSKQVQCWTATGHYCRVTPVIDKVVDTVGAGDTFQAAILARLSEWGDPSEVVAKLDEAGLKELAEFAVKAASITCSRRGADLPRRKELENIG
jgi:fructokinase